MDTTTLTHSFTGPGGTLRWHLRGPSLDVDDWGTHTGYVLVFPTVAERNAYVSGTYSENGTPIGRFALLADADVVTRDSHRHVTEVRFDPWPLSVTEHGWYEGTAQGETLLAEADRLPGSAASRPEALAAWLTEHGIPTEYAGGPEL